jgi:spore coat polysaccharide biosynthesis protein SpsF
LKKYGAIIPIRLTSERLPGKAIKEICGKPIVCHLLDRVFASKYIEKHNAVVCTTREKSDDRLVEIVKGYGASVFRGSTNDIIKRFYDAIKEYNFDTVIQVDGDDILCDTLYMDLTIDRLLSDPSLDIVTCERLPLGIASKSFTRQAMEKVYQHYQSENNDTGFIYFFTKTGLCKKDVVYPVKREHVLDEARLTLDYPKDMELFTKIFEALYKEGVLFTLDNVVEFLRGNRSLMKINSDITEEYWQRTREKAKLQYKDIDNTVKSIKI